MTRFSWVCWLLLLFTGCGGFRAPARAGHEATTGATGNGAPTVETEAPSGGEQRLTGQLSAQSAAPSRAEARAPAADAEEGAPLREQIEERPGLATMWGETRTSHVSSAPFTRASFDEPFAVASIHYDDSVGVRSVSTHGQRDLTRFDDGRIRVAGGLVSVRLLDERGEPLPAFRARGRSFVRGQDGHRYALEIQNHSGTRFEVVATVDGLDVVDGRPGSFAKRGYIVSPFDTLVIDGFRQSFQTVAAFRFGAVRESYAARKGDDRNVGVIGVALFEEAGSRPLRSGREVQRRLDADPFPARFAEPPNGFRP
jgi:hypothetical protein